MLQTIDDLINVSNELEIVKLNEYKNVSRLIEAKVTWNCGHHDVALHLIKNIIIDDETEGDFSASCLM